MPTIVIRIFGNQPEYIIETDVPEQNCDTLEYGKELSAIARNKVLDHVNWHWEIKEESP